MRAKRAAAAVRPNLGYPRALLRGDTIDDTKMPEVARTSDGGQPIGIVDRVDDRIRRAHAKAGQCRAAALGLKSIQIILAASIPVLALVHPSASRPSVNGVLGAAIVMIEGFQHSFRFDHFWIEYRRTAFELESELALYTGHGRPYTGNDAESLFVERVASLIRRQTDDWASAVEKKLPK
jgi:hypothetical protein